MGHLPKCVVASRILASATELELLELKVSRITENYTQPLRGMADFPTLVIKWRRGRQLNYAGTAEGI